MLMMYLLIGACSGLLSGLLGVGGGIIVIPALSSVFVSAGVVPPAFLMHVSIATSLATVIFTSASSLWAHQKRGGVRWDFLKRMAIPLIIGILIGTFLVSSFSSDLLQAFFSLFLYVIGFHLFFSSSAGVKRMIPSFLFHGISAVIGFLSGIFGVGGGTMLVPFLMRCQLSIREATGTSVGCALILALVGSFSFMITGSLKGISLPWATGYLYWPAFLGVSFASILFAPVGTALAYRVGTTMLKRLFAIFLWVVATDLLLFR